MANTEQVGIGGYIVRFNNNGTSAEFEFRDPADVTNTAKVSVTEKDFPDGIFQPDSRQVLDEAYNRVASQLNNKRDERLKEEAEDRLDKQQTEDRRVREAAQDHFANSSDVAVQPAKTDSDGVKIYNTKGAEDTSPDKTK
jgi:hypothetical protein